jgi:hypothetical protein
LSGAGTTTNYMLTGDCYEPSPTGHMCVATPDPTQCPAGKPAVTTGSATAVPLGQSGSIPRRVAEPVGYPALAWYSDGCNQYQSMADRALSMGS